ncbi:MAG TPA: GH1 family beta-glucosidase [Chloroflexota bacterium]|nr:GH1 family beta-glucosidase [Chloroflexota bacterium]
MTPAGVATDPRAPQRGGRFPPGFVWGAATAAYQIEGAVREDGRGESIWDRFSHTPGKTAGGATGDVACDHYHRWPTDLALLRQLGLSAYRFSVAWPRVLPAGRGRPNAAGLDFYERLVDALLAAGLTPWITLYHWDLPQALEDAGGWPARATAEAFAAYVDVVSRRLGDRVCHWITLNEPWCSAFLGYYRAEHAPGRACLADALQAAHTLLLAHGLAVQVLRANCPRALVGIALNLSPAYPASARPADQAAAQRWDGHTNRWFLDPLYGRGYPADLLALYGPSAPRVRAADFDCIAVRTDFLGINYYTPAFVRDAPEGAPLRVEHVRLPQGEYTASGWLVYPQGLYDLLQQVHRAVGRTSPAAPVGALYLTESGAAYADPPPRAGRVSDPQRIRYHAVHLASARRAIAHGVPLRGYFVWSLLDNFEWARGYTLRFGLVYVDYATQQRVIKDSGWWYRRVSVRNALIPPTAHAGTARSL